MYLIINSAGEICSYAMPTLRVSCGGSSVGEVRFEWIDMGAYFFLKTPDGKYCRSSVDSPGGPLVCDGTSRDSDAEFIVLGRY